MKSRGMHTMNSQFHQEWTEIEKMWIVINNPWYWNSAVVLKRSELLLAQVNTVPKRECCQFQRAARDWACLMRACSIKLLGWIMGVVLKHDPWVSADELLPIVDGHHRLHNLISYEPDVAKRWTCKIKKIIYQNLRDIQEFWGSGSFMFIVIPNCPSNMFLCMDWCLQNKEITVPGHPSIQSFAPNGLARTHVYKCHILFLP